MEKENILKDETLDDYSDIFIDFDESNTKDDIELQKIVDYLHKGTFDETLVQKLKSERESDKVLYAKFNQEKQQKIKLAIQMKKDGETIEEIIEETDLTFEEIEKL